MSYKLTKRICKGSTPDTVICKSENEEVQEPFEVDMKDIIRMYIVKGWVCKDVQ